MVSRKAHQGQAGLLWSRQGKVGTAMHGPAGRVSAALADVLQECGRFGWRVQHVAERVDGEGKYLDVLSLCGRQAASSHGHRKGRAPKWLLEIIGL